MKQKININFESFWFPPTESGIKHNYLYRLLSKRFDIELSKDPDFLIYSYKGKSFLKYNCVRIFFTPENIRPNFNECDYAFSFDYPVTEKNYRLPLYKLHWKAFDMVMECNKDAKKIYSEKNKFCNFVYSNHKATERIEFLKKLSKYKNVDSGGKVLNNIGYLVENKIEFQRDYKFSITFENESYPGYTTEKIIHAFAANTVPIYWGNPLVDKDFNTESFINCHDYRNFDEVIEKIIEIDNDEELYMKYLSAPVFTNNEENEYVNESNILDKFEYIFNNKNIEKAAKKTDIFKFYYYLIRSFVRRAIKLLKSFF